MVRVSARVPCGCGAAASRPAGRSVPMPTARQAGLPVRNRRNPDPVWAVCAARPGERRRSPRVASPAAPSIRRAGSRRLRRARCSLGFVAAAQPALEAPAPTLSAAPTQAWLSAAPTQAAAGSDSGGCRPWNLQRLLCLSLPGRGRATRRVCVASLRDSMNAEPAADDQPVSRLLSVSPLKRFPSPRRAGSHSRPCCRQLSS